MVGLKTKIKADDELQKIVVIERREACTQTLDLNSLLACSVTNPTALSIIYVQGQYRITVAWHQEFFPRIGT